MVRLAPVNVRGVGESHETVKQTDSGFGVDARESLGSPLSPEALPNSSPPHDLVTGGCHGGISRGGSRQAKFSLSSVTQVGVWRLWAPVRPPGVRCGSLPSLLHTARTESDVCSSRTVTARFPL